MIENRLDELIFLLSIVSIASWSVVGFTALLRTGARLRYRRRTQVAQKIQKVMEGAAE
jgi:hypothetical protein